MLVECIFQKTALRYKRGSRVKSGIYSLLYVFEARGHYVHMRTVRSKLVEDVGCRQERRDIIEESNRVLQWTSVFLC